MIQLPKPKLCFEHPLGKLLARRRCVREYQSLPVTLAEVACLLWAAQGIVDPQGWRTAPSAGALYPLHVYLSLGNVDELEPGVYRYWPDVEGVTRVASGDRRLALAKAALDQMWLADAPLTLIITACYQRTTWKYGQRGLRYVYLEAGHAAQNVLLMAVALNLGAAVVGAFDDERVSELVGLAQDEAPLYLLPVGHPIS